MTVRGVLFLSVRKLAICCAAFVEHHLNAFVSDPSGNLALVSAFFLIVVKVIFDAIALKPPSRFLDGVAIGNAVEMDTHIAPLKIQWLVLGYYTAMLPFTLASKGDTMAFWDADFTTRAGSETATGQASLACFILAAFRVLAAAFLGGITGLETVEGQLIAGITALEAVVAVVAGFRFRAGKGAFWGIGVAALLGLSILNSVVSIAIGGVVIGGIFLVIIVQGIRGALALRSNAFEEDYAEAFD